MVDNSKQSGCQSCSGESDVMTASEEELKDCPVTNAAESAPEDGIQILRKRKIWREALRAFEEQIPDVPDVSNDDPDTAAETLRGYVGQLQELTAVHDGWPETNLFDRCLGLQRWHIGKALLLLKPLTPGVRGLIKHGELKPFLDAAGLNELLAWRCRAIAHYFPRKEDAAALNWQWTAMIDALPARRKESDDAQAEDEDGEDVDHAPKPDDSQGEDFIEPIGNYVKRLTHKAQELLTATITALQTVESGRSLGLTFSAAREAVGFKAFVSDVEAVVGTIHKSVLNLYQLAQIASESELAEIRDDLRDFLNRHGHGQVQEDPE